MVAIAGSPEGDGYYGYLAKAALKVLLFAVPGTVVLAKVAIVNLLRIKKRAKLRSSSVIFRKR